MPSKKAQAKRGGKQTVKRSSSGRKAVGHLAMKKSIGESSRLLKATRGTVVIGSKSKPGALAILGLKIFSEGVQDALKRLAELNIPAVIRKNGRRIEAVPTKVGGRYVVADVMERRYFLRKVAQGIDAADHGDVVPHEEIEREFLSEE